MQVQVTKDNVCILKKDTVHKGEYNINNVLFEFSKEYTSDLVKVAIFKIKYGKSYQVSIINNQCDIPSEILSCVGEIMLGVYAYKISNEELELRYSPYPTYFTVIGGSYDPSAEESQEITPSQFEQYMQALQNGLTEVNAKLQEVINTSETLEENGTYAKKQGDYAKETTDELISKVENGDFNGATFTPSVSNDGDLSWSNNKGLDNPTTVNIKGQKGDTGEPFTISKTYPSVETMEADFDNMDVGDYVMIASSVNDEDNAKLYVKTDTEWVFITDFSGAIGIQGEPGIGIVSASAGNPSESDGYTITPITFMKTDNSQTTVNVSVKNGEQGPQGEQGIQGDTGVGISTVTAGTPIIDEEKTITPITFNKTDGSNQTVNVEAQNGETQDLSGYATNDDLDNIVPKNTSNGETVSVNDAIAYKAFDFEVDGSSEQVTTTGKNLLPYPYVETEKTENGITYTVNDNGSVLLNGTATSDTFLILFGDIAGTSTYDIPGDYVSGGTSDAHVRAVSRLNGEYHLIADNTSGFTKIDKSVYTKGYVEIKITAGKTFNNVTVYPMLSNEQNIDWEPYTGGQPSPSPDYPQEIKTLTFDRITRCGKNFLPNNLNSKTINGLTITKNDDNSITINGTSTAYTTLYFVDNFILPKGDYTLSYHSDGQFPEQGYIWTIATDLENNQIFGFAVDYTSSKTLNKNTTFSKIGIAIQTGAEINNLTLYPMIERGLQATNYEPYQGQTYDIDLQGNEMVELPNGAKDELVIDKYGNVSLIKNVGKIVFDGSDDENWFILDFAPRPLFDIRITDVLSLLDQSIKNPTLCTNFISYSPNDIWMTNITGICIVQDSNVIRIGFKDNPYQTSEEFKSWLSTHNTILYYPLANQQTIPLGTLSELITTINGTNNISINGNIPTTISTTYALDIKKYIDNKLAEISTAMIEEG